MLPYRPPLPTAKAVATVQELSGGRLILGVGVGWMQAEFDALGIPRSERGRRTDETLAFLRDCFARDEVASNGQPFLFRPRPSAPPIIVGGAGEHALRRTVAYGDGWMPLTTDATKLAPGVQRLRELCEEAGRRETPDVFSFGGFDPTEPERGREMVATLAESGVGHIVAALRYEDVDGFRRHADFLAAEILPTVLGR